MNTEWTSSPWIRWSWPLSSDQLEVPLQLGACKFTPPQKLAGAKEARLLAQTRNQVSLGHFLAGDGVERSWNFSKGFNPSGRRVGIVTPLQRHSLSWWLSGSGIHPPMLVIQVWSLGREGPLEKKTAIHSSILAWEISRTEGPGELQSMGSQKESNTTWRLNNK